MTKAQGQAFTKSISTLWPSFITSEYVKTPAAPSIAGEANTRVTVTITSGVK